MNRIQALNSLQAYLSEDKEIIKIVNLCNLNPVDSSTSGWKEWQNEYAPYIKVQKNKKLATRLKEEDYFTPKKDLYAYSNLVDVAKISKKLLFTISKDCFCFLFWGKDDKLRFRRYLGDTYLNNPALFVPIEDIRILVKNEYIDGYTKIKLVNSGESGWVTSWPPKKEFYQELKKEIKKWNNQVESLIQECCVM